MTEAAAPTSQPLQALVVVNPVAPHADGERLNKALEDTFAPGGGTFTILETRAHEDLPARLDRELTAISKAGGDLVIVAGGDGTVSAVAAALARRSSQARPMVLGIVPLGTANVLARELAIPLDIQAAVAVAVERRRVVSLDAIVWNDLRFMTQVGVGVDASMIELTSRDAQKRFKRLAYMAALVRAVVGHRACRFTVVADGRTMRFRAWQVVVANAATFGAQPFRWGQDVNPTDGILDLCIYDVRRLADIGLLWTVLTGRQRGDSRVRIVRVKQEVTIEAARPLPVQGDGEIFAETPVTVTIQAGAVRVVTPVPPETVAEQAGVEADTRMHTAQLKEAAAPPQSTPIPKRTRARLAQHVLMHQVATVGAIDAALFLKINGLPGHPVFDRVLTLASRLLDHGEAWVVTAIALALADPARNARMPFEVIPALWITMLAVNFPIKSLFQRRRPFVSYVKARVIGRKPLDSSFPSGHSAAAFAGAALLTPVAPALAPLFYGYAVIVAFSRVYLGVHYPSDVLIGAGVGTVLALALGAVARAVVAG